MSTPIVASNVRGIGGWAGILAAVLLVASFLIIGEPPSADASADEIAAFLVDSRSVGLLSVLFAALALPLFAVFAGAIRESVSGTVGQGLAGAGAAGGVLFMFLNALVPAVFFGLAWQDGVVEGMIADIARAAWSVGNTLYAIAGPVAVLFLGVAALAGLRGAMSKWQSWAALVIAAVLLIGTLNLVNSELGVFGFFGSVLFAIWILATSIRMLVREE
jgi:hypothetical protein